MAVLASKRLPVSPCHHVRTPTLTPCKPIYMSLASDTGTTAVFTYPMTVCLLLVPSRIHIHLSM